MNFIEPYRYITKKVHKSDLPPRLYIAGTGWTDEGKVNIKVKTITIVIESIFFQALKLLFIEQINLFEQTQTDKNFFIVN